MRPGYDNVLPVRHGTCVAVQLHARILRGKGVQKKKPNMFTVGSSTSATFVLPVYVI